MSARNRMGRPRRQYPTEIVELARSMYVDQGMTVAEIRAVFPKGYRVQTILERYLPERRPMAKRDQRGAKNHMWQGEGAGYQAAHLRMGSAKANPCVDCGECAAHWSYQGGCEDERDGLNGPPYCVHPSHYRPRCIRCHHRYDTRGRRANGQMSSREEANHA